MFGLEKISALVFDAAVLVPLKIAHRIGGDSIWPPLEAVTAISSRAAGGVLRPVIGAENKAALPVATVLMDRIEGLLGIEGEWEMLDERSAVRKVRSCPFAGRLHGSSQFCTLLGGAMGRESVAGLYPGREVVFEVRRTLSQGEPFCEYFLRVA